MLRRLLGLFTGGQGAGNASAAPTDAPSPVPPPGLSPTMGETQAPGTGPVFSSRAVRDAAVVTAAIEAVKRFADGQATAEEAAYRLSTLSGDQFDFLQISIDAGLTYRAVEKARDAGGIKAAELRTRLAQLVDGVGAPPPINTAPRMAKRAIPTAPARPGAPKPESAAMSPLAPPLAASPLATPLHSAEEAPTVPVPPPPPRPPEAVEQLPRMAREDAEARRARLLQSLTDHLSTSEAAR